MSVPAISGPTGAQIWPSMREEVWPQFLSRFFSGPLYERFFDERAAKQNLRWFRRKGANIAFRAISSENAENLEKSYREFSDVLGEYVFIGPPGLEPSTTKVDDKLQKALALVRTKGFDKLSMSVNLDDVLVLTTLGLDKHRKRSLLGYVAEASVTPSAYKFILISYPIFLFIRSIIWAIRVLRCRAN